MKSFATMRKAFYAWLSVAVFACTAFNVTSVKAQISLSSNATYSQNFNGLASSGTANAITQNSNVPAVGWYAQRTGTGTTYTTDSGSSNAGNLYSYGNKNSSDRAMGSIGSSNAAAGSFAYGLRLQNNTGYTVKEFSIQYTGEQWRNSAAAAQTVTFWYQVSSSAITSALPGTSNTGWTAETHLDFTSPITGGTAGLLNGNATANRTTISYVLSSLSVADGNEIMFRWSDIDHTGNDHGLAIDDFSYTYEPVVVPTAFTTNNKTATSYDVSFTAAAVAPTGYIVFRSTGSAPTISPADGTTYTAGSSYTGGDCVYIGNGTTFSESSLSTGTTYYYKIFAYNGSGTMINYLQSSPLQGNETPASGSTPVITITGTINDFSTVNTGSVSSEQSYTVAGSNLSTDITITPPSTDFEISTGSGGSFVATNPIVLTQSSGTVGTTTIYVRFNPSSSGSKSGNITHTSTGAGTQTIALSGTGRTIYYLASSGNAEQTSSWGTNTDGTGTNPANFTADDQVFEITNQSSATIGGDWVVSGSSSKVILGNGSAITFTIPATNTLTGTIDLTANCTLVLQNSTINHTYGVVSASSTIQFAQSGTYTLPGGTYNENITLTGGTKTLASGTTTINGNLIVDDVSGFNGAGSPFSTLNLGGNFTLSNTVSWGAVANAFTLVCNGGGTQMLTGNSNDFNLFRLQTTGTTNVVLADGTGSSNLVLGNTSGGGLSLNTGTTLTTNTNSITFYNGGPQFAGTGTITASASTNITINRALGTTAPIGTIYFTSGSSTINNLTLNTLSTTANKLILGSDLTINGTLALTSGQFDISSRNLTLNGTYTSGGTFTGNTTANLTLQNSADLGTITFTAGAENLGNLTLNMGSGSKATLGSILTINGTLTLTQGYLDIAAYNLTIAPAGSTGDGNAGSYVMISSTGVMKRTVTTSATLFPIGYNPYLPVTLTMASGSAVVDAAVQNTVTDITNTPITTNVVGKTWTITPEATISDVTVGLQWNGTDELGGFDRTASRVAYRTTNTSDWIPTGSFGAATGTDPYSLTSGTITTLNASQPYLFGVGDGISPLPVSLISFEAKREGSGAQLYWQTSSETNNAGFEVLKSNDGYNWNKIGFVAGSGNSQAIKNYDFLDAGPYVFGKVYYRLNQTDYNGQHSYSEIRAVRFGNQTNASVLSCTIAPNPATDAFRINWTSGNDEVVYLQVNDMFGNTVYNQQLNSQKGNNSQEISDANWKAASYIITLKSSDSIINQILLKTR
jgi:hypothetical protein